MRYYLFFILTWASVVNALAQVCHHELRLNVGAAATEAPLAYANVLLKATSYGGVTDEGGSLVLTGICAGDYEIQVTYLGYDQETIALRIDSDTTLTIRLNTQAKVLEKVEVTASARQNTGQTETVLKAEALEQGAGQNLGNLVEGLAGLSVIKNGSGIAKPVIHGLTGNRIAILNNGIVQAGQQWGVDHAPEIDPFTADRIRVIKGVESLAYGGNTLGGAILVEPGNIARDGKLHGAAQYVFGSNGRQHSLSTRWEKRSDWLAWRIVGTLKHAGDHRTPDYFLRNTGLRERNVALLLEKTVGNNWLHTLYSSYFNTELGILRGAHIGNTTDLATAIGREEPFFTRPDFSYDLEEPRQAVRHQLWKYNTKYYFSNNHSLQFTYAYQRNRRQEFDVRRGDRSEKAALDLALQAHFVDLFWQSERGAVGQKLGLQYRFNENDNQPGTGVLPLIPDYSIHVPALYYLRSGQRDHSSWQLGGRYDFVAMQVAAISRELPRTVERFQHRFHNYSLAAGWESRFTKTWTSKWNVGWVRRSPEVNELYSSGLHQGVASIEEGNEALRPEQSLKGTWTNTLQIGDYFQMEAVGYYQLIQDFIYLQPEQETRLTIRGAFPVFGYEQTDARLAGLDLTTKVRLHERWQWDTQYALVRGYDRTEAIPLVYMPADRIQSELKYTFKKTGSLTVPFLRAGGRYVFSQTRLLPEQDFLAPPPAYFLANVALGAELKGKLNTWRFSIQVNNLLNERYRDYLNRLRYYADEEGRNIRLNLRMEF